MKHLPEHHRPTTLALLACGLALAPAGCSSRAYREVYEQRLIKEARVLEDELYDAAYENRVLRDKLEACKNDVQAAQIPAPSLAAPDRPEAGRRPEPRRFAPADDLPETPPADFPDLDIDMGENLEPDEDLPLFDDGTPVDPGELPPPAPPLPAAPELPAAPDLPEPEPAIPQADPLPDAELDPPSGFDPDGFRLPGDELDRPLLPAPGGPVPPGREDLEPPLIEPGEILPPPGRNEEVQPPGQIPLPEAIRASEGVPEQLQLHPSLSSGQLVDGELVGVKLVVNALDQAGRFVDLSQFEVAASLTIVVLDPTRPAEDARIGRWEYDEEQLASLIRSDPVDGLHVFIPWQDEKPQGDQVIVHVRLRSEADDMRCEGALKLNAPTRITDWTPRGEILR